METFVYWLGATVACQMCAAGAFKDFGGASEAAHLVLAFIGGALGWLLLIGITIWGCCITTWWHPIVAYIVGALVGGFVSAIPGVNVLLGVLGFVVALITTIVQMI